MTKTPTHEMTEKLIQRVGKAMDDINPNDEEFATLTKRLAELYKMLEIENNNAAKEADRLQRESEHTNDVTIKTTENKIRQDDLILREKGQIIDEEQWIRDHNLRVTELELKEKEHQQRQEELDNQRRISPTTVLTVAANILAIVMIIGHERTGILKSTALSFVPKAFK